MATTPENIVNFALAKLRQSFRIKNLSELESTGDMSFLWDNILQSYENFLQIFGIGIGKAKVISLGKSAIVSPYTGYSNVFEIPINANIIKDKNDLLGFYCYDIYSKSSYFGNSSSSNTLNIGLSQYFTSMFSSISYQPANNRIVSGFLGIRDEKYLYTTANIVYLVCMIISDNISTDICKMDRMEWQALVEIALQTYYDFKTENSQIMLFNQQTDGFLKKSYNYWQYYKIGILNNN